MQPGIDRTENSEGVQDDLTSRRRAAFVGEQVDDSGSDADALAPRHPRKGPARRARGVAESEKGRSCPFGTKEICTEATMHAGGVALLATARVIQIHITPYFAYYLLLTCIVGTALTLIRGTSDVLSHLWTG